MSFLKDDIFNLADIIFDTAKKHPNRIAVIEPNGFESDGKRKYKKHTYAQLSADTESVAPGLREMGIIERTRVVCMTPPGYESCVIGLALQRVGAMTIWIDPAVGYINVGKRLRRIQPEAFVGIPAALLGRTFFGWGPRFPKKSIVIDGFFPGSRTIKSLRRKEPKNPPKPDVTPNDPVTVLYTTGSTGPAKPTLYLHRNYSHVYRIAHQSWRFDPEIPPVDMAIFPAFFFIALSAGGTVVVPPIKPIGESPAKSNPKALLEVINDCNVQTCFASPILLENMAKYAVNNHIKTPTLKRIIGGGAPIFSGVKKTLLEMMGAEGQVFANYGATEALPSTEMGAQEALAETFPLTDKGAGLCVGRPFDGVEIRIIRIVDGPISSINQTEKLPNGEIGEILVRGQHISPGYYLDPQSDIKNKVPDPKGQWHRLGDTGYIDEKNRLWTCGRVGQRVKSKEGESILPLLTEPIFDSHPQVNRSGLVGVLYNGVEVPVICVQLNQAMNVSEKDIRKSLLEMAASHPSTQAIQHVLFVEKLPVDPRHNSKIERPELARWASKKLKTLTDFKDASVKT
ncbi:MAG TPA: fatty acid CoA ligase family protein [Chitinophagales bacterium]|nr:fatty acid CoA ligase family protein [Chitinophagales bacterium]